MCLFTVNSTVGDVLNVIFIKYAKDLAFVNKTEDLTFDDFKKEFVLKPRGRDDYLLMQKVKLLDVECIIITVIIVEIFT